MLVLIITQPSQALALSVSAPSAILMDSETGQVLYEKNSHVQREMASTTKIMTYLLTMEAIDQGKISLNDRVTVSPKAAATKGSSYRLKAGDRLTVSELLSSMMIISANDSSVVLAEHVSGSLGAFVRQMNDRAKSLGLESAYFVNPNGMPLANQDQNKMSAKDLGILSQTVLNQYGDQLIRITSQKQFHGSYRSFSKKNTNRLLTTTSFTDGLKTGYTNRARHCLVSTTKVKGASDNRFIAVILGGQSSNQRFADSQKMLEYGLNNFETQTVIKEGEVLGHTQIASGNYMPIELIAKESISILSPKNRNLSKNKELVYENYDLQEDTLESTEVTTRVKLANGTEIEVPAIPRRGIGVLIDDKPLICEPTNPFIKDGTTLVPLSKISSQLGTALVWEPVTKTITSQKGDRSFSLSIGNKQAMINGNKVELATAPVILEGTTMVPIKFIAESLGMDVRWESEARTVVISSEEYLAGIAQ